MDELDLNLISNKIRTIPDYPKKGVMFRDITTLLKDGRAFSMCIEEMAKWAKGKDAKYIVGIEARGFIIGAALAVKLGIGFVPIRKKGKLPYKTVSKRYQLEYGEDEIEMHKDAIERGSGVIIVDDLLATGGTARAVTDLVESVGGKILGIAFLIELKDLKGREKLKGYEIHSLLNY